MYHLIVQTGAAGKIVHGLTNDQAQEKYQEEVLKGDTWVFSVDGDTVETLIDSLDDDENPGTEWEEVMHEHPPRM